MRLTMRLQVMFLLVVGVALASMTMLMSHPASAQTTGVTIANFAFSPNPITVTVGTTVTWTNQDTAPHTATADDNSWTTDMLQKGQSGSITFNTPGSFPYHCKVHPNMHGMLIVQAAGTPAATTTSPSATVPATAPPLAAYPVFPSRQKAPRAAKILTAELNGKYLFKVKSLTVHVGTKVTWVNATDAPHTVTGTRGWTFASKTFSQNGKVSFVFTKPGTYHYFCAIHPYMKATIVVVK